MLLAAYAAIDKESDACLGVLLRAHPQLATLVRDAVLNPTLTRLHVRKS